MQPCLSGRLYSGESEGRSMKKKHWYDYLWIWSILYFFLGFFNILFAWLGMIDFLVPVLIAVIGGNKWFCNNLCGRGQLFTQIGGKWKCSRNKKAPHSGHGRILKQVCHKTDTPFPPYFGNIISQTCLVAAGASSLTEAIQLFWTFKVPWGWAYSAGTVTDWVAKFSFGFYSLMLTSMLIGLIVMALYRPRTWCSFCPMGTMTQSVCKIKNRD